MENASIEKLKIFKNLSLAKQGPCFRNALNFSVSFSFWKVIFDVKLNWKSCTHPSVILLVTNTQVNHYITGE